MKNVLAWIAAIVAIGTGLALGIATSMLAVAQSPWEWPVAAGLLVWAGLMGVWAWHVGRLPPLERTKNNGDTVCSVCAREGDVLRCPACRSLCCKHYSVWADDDPRGPTGEQLVHRCTWCEVELEPVAREESKS